MLLNGLEADDDGVVSEGAVDVSDHAVGEEQGDSDSASDLSRRGGLTRVCKGLSLLVVLAQPRFVLVALVLMRGSMCVVFW